MLDSPDGLRGRAVKVRCGQVHAGRELDVQAGRGVELRGHRTGAAVEDVAAASEVLGDEVHVEAADLERAAVLREAEADERPANVAQLVYVLAGDNLGEWPVGRRLPRDGAGPDELEVPVDAHRAGGGALRERLSSSASKAA